MKQYDLDENGVIEYKLETAPIDLRFPNTNQTRHCWQLYVDYHKCIRAKGEDFEPCKAFKRNYLIMCPDTWVERWDEAINENRSPFDLEPPEIGED